MNQFPPRTIAKPPALRIHSDEIIADNFAGGGGASTGIEWALGRSPDIAINHDRDAIAMHAANHPQTRHFCEDVWQVDPREVCKARPALAWFSPDCKHFSKAKGGKPVDKKIRGLAWVVIRWAKAARPRVILLENVEEFEDWGPLGPDQKPDPLRKGLTFRIWKGKLEALGYRVEYRELVAADYGAPTLRKRLFLVARCDGLPIVWPRPTHGRGMQPHRTAAECIDWSLPTYSIFLSKEEGRQYGVKRPLADNTMRRIARGLRKFVLENPEPFIVGVGGRMGQSPERSVSRPFQTITAKGDAAIVTPYIAQYHTAKRPGDDRAASVAIPLPTQTTENRFGLIAPTLIQTGYGERKGQAPRAPGLDKPLGTIVGTGKHALVAAFLAKHYGGNYDGPGTQMSMPLDTITSRDHNALVLGMLSHQYGSATNGGQGDPEKPLKTITSGGHHAVVNAFMVAYYGNEKDGGDLFDPMRTVTSRERFGLISVHGTPYVLADIGMRMLAPRELFRAQGFGDDYVIDPLVDGKPLTKDAQVRCVGNSVVPNLAAALARAQFEDQVIEVAA